MAASPLLAARSVINRLRDHPRRAAWVGAGLLVLLAVATYGRTLGRGWVVAPTDDLDWLAMVRGASLRDLPGWFVSQPAFFYRPLTRLAFFADYLVWRDNPLGFRLTNLGLYIAAAAALGWLVYEATRSRTAGLFAATLYALYPANWEVAYWISTRADILAALFVLAALALLLRARRKWRLSLWLGAMGCAVAALFSKEAGLALLPLVTVGALVMAPSLRGSRRYWMWIGITLAALAVLALAYWHLRSLATAMGAHHLHDIGRIPERLPKAMRWGGGWWYQPLLLHLSYIKQGAVPGAATLLAVPTIFLGFWGQLAAWAAGLTLAFTRAPRAALWFFVFHLLAALPAVGEIVFVPFRRFFYLPVAGDMALAGLACWALVMLALSREKWRAWAWTGPALWVGLLAGYAWHAHRITSGLGDRLFGR